MAPRKTTVRKKKTVSQQGGGVNPLLVALGAGAGAAGGAGMGMRKANKTKARIPVAASKIAQNSIDAFNTANNRGANYGRYEAAADDKAYAGTTNAKDSAFYRQEARENRILKEKNKQLAAEISASGRMVPSTNKKIINRKLNRAPEVALSRTKKYAKRGGAAGGALAVLAQLVAAEMSKKK